MSLPKTGTPSRRSPAILSTALVATVFANLWIGGGCNKQHASNSERSADAPKQAGEPAGRLMVFAAASLTEAFSDIAKSFEEKYPRVTVETNFAGSQSLRTQIANGAKPQVFASANQQHMDALADQRLVDSPSIFARNELVIAVPSSNPANIQTLHDLPRAQRLVVAEPSVPAGAYTEAMLAKASTSYGPDFANRVLRAVVSRETHVRQTLQKVVLGEADAAIVYATDVTASTDKVKAIAIDPEHNVVASYPIATLTEAARTELGRLFIDFVHSDTGRELLHRHGFRSFTVPAAASQHNQ